MPLPLVIAVRVYPDPKRVEKDFDTSQRKWRLPDATLVFDTETRTDQVQRLTFGSYRFIVDGQLASEKLFWGDDLPTQDRRILERYIAAAKESVPRLSGFTRGQFVDKLFLDAYKGRCLLVAFNFPFDISRVARNFTNARGRFAGGFSLDLWSYSEGRNRFRPSICIKQIDSKRALKGFTSRKWRDDEDKIPEGSLTGEPEDDYIFHGHSLDLRTLAFALTDRGYTLERACHDFGVEHGKQVVKKHGIVARLRMKRSTRWGFSVMSTSIRASYQVACASAFR